MSSWSPSEFAALFQAWREAIDTPLNERNKISHEVFRRFTVLVGGSTERSEGSVSFKQGSLKNMATLVMAFNDRDKWFAFSLEQKKKWFKMVNRKSYKFIDLDRPMFRTIEKLIQYQAASTNMRVTSASGSAADYAESSFARVTLRRNPISRRWTTHGVPPVMPALYSPLLAPLPVAQAQRLKAPAFLPPPAPRAPVAAPRAQTQAPRKEFPFQAAPRGTSDSRSIFVLSSASSLPPRPTQHAVVQDQAVRPSNQNDVIVFDDGEYDSGSSTESDSDVELWEESQSVAARLKYLESKSAPVPVAPAMPHHQVANNFILPPAQHSNARSPVARQPPVATQKEKRSRPPPPLSPLFASSGFKKQKSEPELMMVVNILEKQAQELKTLLTEVREERAGDELQREKELVEKSARDTELQQILETIKAEAEFREKEHKQRAIYQQECSQLMEEIARLHEERKEFEQEQKREEEARTAMLKQIAQDQEERRNDLKQRERERKEREVLVEQIKQDREDRKRARAERKMFMKQMQEVSNQKARVSKDNREHEKLPEKARVPRDTKEHGRLPERPKKRESVGASLSGNSSNHRETEQENKRPSSASGDKETSSKTFSSKMADKEKKWKQMREDQNAAQPQRSSSHGRPLDYKPARSVKKLL